MGCVRSHHLWWTQRKLIGLAVVESYSRMLYIEFAHSQKQAVLHQVLLNAFLFFGGTPREVVTDNMLTAVTERAAGLIRYNEAFLEFLRPFKITPKACNIYKLISREGKSRKQHRLFLPLRTFQDLEDTQIQVINWLKTVADARTHQTTGEIPRIRHQKVLAALLPLPGHLPDTRETITALVHKDFTVRFDSNAYSTPPWSVGKKVGVKASQKGIGIYYLNKRIADHLRCWEKKQRIEIPAHLEQLQKKPWEDRNIACFISYGDLFQEYLTKLADRRQPIKQTVAKLLDLIHQYGVPSLKIGIQKAMKHKAYGADYIENILYQEMMPQHQHLPVKLKQEKLNHIRLPEPNLTDYDAIALKRRHQK